MDNIKGVFQSALDHHQAGDLTTAANFYHKVLEIKPTHIDALFLLGTLNLQLGNFKVASDFLRKTVTFKPDHSMAHGNLGSSLQGLGRFDEAALSYQEALSLNPDYAEGYYNLANTLKKMGEYDDAIKNYRKALLFTPDDPEIHTNLGNVLREQNKLAEAVVSYRVAMDLDPNNVGIGSNLGATLQELGKLDEAIEIYKNVLMIKPDYAKLYNTLGGVLMRQHKRDEAIENYREAIALEPDYVEAYDNLGTALQEQGRLEEAIENYHKALSLRSDYVRAYNNLANVLKKQGRYDEAVANYLMAVAIEPDNAVIYSNLGTAQQEWGHLEEAIENYHKAVKIDPDYAEAYSNLGAALQEQGKLEEAIASCDRAISLKPDFAMAHLNRSISLLLSGNYQEGWAEYEWRLCTERYHTRIFQKPRWNGTALKSRSILVHAEQGFGDTIQFVRYLPMVRSRGGHVIFECQRSLLRLLRCCEGVDKIIDQNSPGEPSEIYDFHVPLLSLPGIFGTTLGTIPLKRPYIHVDEKLSAKWHKIIGSAISFKVGLVWAGGPSRNYVYFNRSCTLNDFAPLAEVSGVTFYALQKGPAATEVINPPERMEIHNLERELHDFAETAAVIDNLDLVISVDTAVVHLAGALGKPVWTLLPFSPDWRWMLDREESQWYPSMRLFRQRDRDGWDRVIERVKRTLVKEVEGFRLKRSENGAKVKLRGSINTIQSNQLREILHI